MKTLALAFLLVPTAALAADASLSLDRMFPREADVTTTSTGLSRLDLPAEVLSSCRPDLSDVRLFDADGAEVPYLVDAGRKRDDVIELVHRVAAPPLNVTRDRWPLLETFDIAVPPGAPENGWTLTFAVEAPRFVRSVRIDALDASGRATPLVTGESIFRISADREKRAIPIPPTTAARLRVTVQGESSWIEPVLAFEGRKGVAPGAGTRVPLTILSTQTRDGRTVLEIARPAGLLPDEIEIRTSTGVFDRVVEVWDEGASAGSNAIGSTAIWRISEGVEARTIPVAGAHGDRLRLVIRDGDSPALRDPVVVAVVRRPALIFSMAPRANAPAGVLRFGGGRTWRPVYDLAGLGPAEGASGLRARIAAEVFDATALPAATLGAARDNGRFDASPRLAFAMRAGAPVDVRRFASRRTLSAEPSAEGLSRLHLAPEDLAAARADLADLRIVDEDSKQWPFLLARDAVPTWFEAPPSASRRGVFAVPLPASPVPVDAVSIDVDSPFFDRNYRLKGVESTAVHDPRDASSREITLASGHFSRRAGDPRPVEISFGSHRMQSITLEIDDGDDAPLSITGGRVRVDASEVYLIAPAGNYSLLLGSPEEAAPQYEVASVRALVLAVPSGTVRADVLDRNPTFSRAARLEQTGVRDAAILWGAIILAVIGLGLLTLKLARTPPEEPASSPGK